MKVTNTFKGKVKTYLVKRLGAFEYKHGWLRVPTCPYCHRENKMGVNLSMYRTNCFRCGAHPNPGQLIMDVEHLETYHELLTLLDNGDFNELTFREQKVELAEAIDVNLPEGFTLVSFGKSQLSRTIQNYLLNRKFSLSELSKQGVGYCTKGDLFGYVIIPFYNNGQLRYYNARNVIGKGPRYNNPNKDLTGLGKEFIIFNQDAINIYRTIYICEGAFNALTMGPAGIATMGKAVSRYQINLLIKSSAQHFIILLDDDAKLQAIKLALELVPFKKVKVVYMPEGKDCNDLGRSSTLKLIHKTRYQSYQDLINLKNNL